MRETLKYFNLKELSIETGISYNTLKNYSCGRKKELDQAQEQLIKDFIKTLI